MSASPSMFTPAHLAVAIGCPEPEAVSRMRLVGGYIEITRDVLRARQESKGDYLPDNDLSLIARRFLPREEWFLHRHIGHRMAPDVVYFIQCGDAVKIGYTRNVEKRMAHFRNCNPAELKLLALISGAVQVERDLHVRFSAQKIHGEWFRNEGALAALLQKAPNR